jgi:hypothetical protein
MNIFRYLWQKERFLVLSVVIFSLIYVIIGCLWFLAPSGKYAIGQPRSYIDWVVPVLGGAIFFLNFPPYVFVPVLAIAGGFTGLLTRILLGFKWPVTLLGMVIWTALGFINFYIGLFLYIFAIMRW